MLLEQQPDRAREYRFESIEVKETSFRIDGVFLPPEDASPRVVYFAEVQHQKDEGLYYRFFSETSIYLHRNQDLFDDWYGVIVFSSRSIEPSNAQLHRTMLNGDQVKRIYLDEIGELSEQPIGLRLMQLTVIPEKEAPEQARELIRLAKEGDTGFLSKEEIIDMVCTIAVYKFSKLSRVEVEAMLGLSLEETKVYQEASAEGEERGILKGEQTGIIKGKLEGEQTLILRQLTRRIGSVAPEVRSQVQALTLVQLEFLGEALLDFSETGDLVTWLSNNAHG